jgi:hypothetical protein
MSHGVPQEESDLGPLLSVRCDFKSLGAMGPSEWAWHPQCNELRDVSAR